MKNKPSFFLLALSLVFICPSCNKTYECKDAYGLSTGQVKARSVKKAKEICPLNSTVVLVK